LKEKNGSWDWVLDRFRDLGLALRALGQRPLFTGVAVLVLALGIGASTAIFTLLDAVILSPLPFDEPDRLVAISHRGEGPGREDMGQTAAWHFTYEDENRVFVDLGMYRLGSVAVTGVGPPEAVPALYATGGVIRALRVSPVLGRSFIPEDEELGAPPTLLLSHSYWQNRFGGDAGVLGQTLRINGVSWEIVGVMPPSLRGLGYDPALVVPLRYDRSRLFVGNTGWDALARLRDGVTSQQASADMKRMLPMAFEKFPGGPVIDTMRKAKIAPSLQSLKDEVVGSVSGLLWVLMAGVGAVLLIACANVANLFLVRAEGKDSEMALRTALGASPTRIAWEYLKESLVLGALGGIGGLVLALAGLRVLLAMSPTEIPRLEEVSLSSTVLLFTSVVSLVSGLLFGAAPALRHCRRTLVDSLRQGHSWGMGGGRRGWAQNTLAVSQIALALLLLVASGLMFRTLDAVRSVDPGFHGPEELLALRLTLSDRMYPGVDKKATTHEEIARRLGEIPGVSSVALANAMPLDGSWNVNPFYAEGVTPLDEPSGSRSHKWLGAGYFETLGIPLLRGRAFTWHDIQNRAPVAVVSERLAREYWGSPQAAMGQRIAARPDPPRWYEVIGVAADVHELGLDQEPPVLVYWPQVTLAFWQDMAADEPNTWSTMGYAIRSPRVGTVGFEREVQDAIWSVDPELPVRNLRSLPLLIDRSMARTSFALVLLGIAAGVALLLGMTGVYGVISYSVSQRTGELGMRMVLGARSKDVTRMILWEATVLSATGVAIGLALSFGLTRLMAGLLFGVSPVDPVSFTSVASGLLAVALLASYLPARRAAAVDPVDAIRAT